ncbi:uncharacterized protein si:ch211-191i18.2 [Gadus chalcogrammus]|uniref:uncharacterized protein si:ch211-191i18.2 n=1 Tax=Gadus chalcogrammus TaxID=1042646 RepID=UPI0024C49F73|nr:uncharacterized protein si:ch211-191i18.2 [Gadus chalcogrammus]
MPTISRLSPVFIVQLSALLLLPLCWGASVDFYDDATPVPEYDDDTTIIISFFSNSSSDDLDLFLNATEEDGGEAEAVTMTTTITSPAGDRVTVPSSASPPRVPVSGPVFSLLLCVSLSRVGHTY